MKQVKLNGQITKELNQTAREILSDTSKSFDSKRVDFYNKLETYYKEGDHSTVELIERLSEIDYDKRLNDVLLSATIGTLLGILFTFLNDPFEYANPVVFLIHYLGIALMVIAITYVMLRIIKRSMQLTGYALLHCEAFERDLIEQKLAERLEKVKNEQALAREAIPRGAYAHDGNEVRGGD